jgi:hypothetical protein
MWRKRNSFRAFSEPLRFFSEKARSINVFTVVREDNSSV